MNNEIQETPAAPRAAAVPDGWNAALVIPVQAINFLQQVKHNYFVKI